MPIQMPFTDARKVVRPESHWEITVFGFSNPAAQAWAELAGWKDAAARAAGKAPLPGAETAVAVAGARYAELAPAVGATLLPAIYAQASADPFFQAGAGASPLVMAYEDASGDAHPASVWYVSTLRIDNRAREATAVLTGWASAAEYAAGDAAVGDKVLVVRDAQFDALAAAVGPGFLAAVYPVLLDTAFFKTRGAAAVPVV